MKIMNKLLIITSMVVFIICCSTAVFADEPPVPSEVMDSLPEDNMNWFDKYEAALKEAGAEEKQAVLPNERVINYGEVRNDRPALLLIHGQQSIWEDYALVLPELSEKWHIYAVDVYGHGESSHEEELYYLDVNGDDLIWFIDHVIGEPTVVAGHSNGGITAAYIAAYGGENVVGAVLEDPPLFSTEGENWENNFSYLDTFKPLHEYDESDKSECWEAWYFRHCYWGQMYMKEMMPMIADYAQQYHDEHPGEPVKISFLPYSTWYVFQYEMEYDFAYGEHFYDLSWNHGLKHEDILEAIEVPCVFIHAMEMPGPNGVNLSATTREQAERAVSYIGENCRLVETDTNDHVIHTVHSDVYIDAVNALLDTGEYEDALDAGYEPDEEDQEHLIDVPGEGDDLNEAGMKAAEEAQFTVQTFPLRDDDSQIGTLDLRFYADKPNIAYIGIKNYMATLQELDITVSAKEDGTLLLTNPNGTSIKADPAADTIYAENWTGFQTADLPYIGEKKGVKDTDCWWTEVLELIYDEEATPVTFDFAKYGIDMYADGEDVYLPLAVIGGMLEDESLYLLAFNGDTAFKYSGNVKNIETFSPGYYEGEKIKALINGEAQRAEDQINESYAEICFFVDYFFGHPGVGVLDAAVMEKGLDAALDDLPDGLGVQIRESLHSPDYVEYLCGINDLLSFGFSDGHTVLMTLNALMLRSDLFPTIIDSLQERLMPSLLASMNTYQAIIKSEIEPVRQQIWGDETYREYGNTAIIRIDGFHPDEAGWAAWKEGTGELPDDALGITWTGLQKAMANPEIKNIILDLTDNAGGSQDLMQAIIGMFTGDVSFNGYNPLTKQHMHAIVKTDRNMDGVIDEKDQEVHYDYNLGVLTTRAAFSCGNLFPVMMQDKGAIVIGENTGGGSCVVQMITLSDGPVFSMSSYLYHLRDAKGEEVEKGADPDIPLERIEITDTVNPYFPRLTPGDYSPYYNDEMLDNLMNDWFAQEEVPAA